MQLNGLLAVCLLDLNLGCGGLHAQRIVVLGVDHHLLLLSVVLSVSKSGLSRRMPTEMSGKCDVLLMWLRKFASAWLCEKVRGKRTSFHSLLQGSDVPLVACDRQLIEQHIPV